MRFDRIARKLGLGLMIAILYGAGVATAVEAPVKPGNESRLSDKELKAFAKAYVDYQKIRRTYAPALEQAKDPAQKKQIEQEANAKIKRSLDAQGLSVARYNQIFAQVNSDPPLRKRVLQQVEEERKRS
jgi:uncharacterized protein DUF4168